MPPRAAWVSFSVSGVLLGVPGRAGSGGETGVEDESGR